MIPADVYLPALNTLTFLVSLWIAVSLHRHRTVDRDHGVPLKARLRHPMKSCDELDRRK